MCVCVCVCLPALSRIISSSSSVINGVTKWRDLCVGVCVCVGCAAVGEVGVRGRVRVRHAWGKCVCVTHTQAPAYID